MLSNLLTNAAKYTPPGGRIELTAEVRDGQVLVGVSDNGIGIDPELMPHVFDLFRQARRTADRSRGGLGLGLAPVRSIMALHGGSVEGHSEGVGKGTRFTLALPLFAAHPAAAAEQATPDAPAAPIGLMIVDDNVDAARTLAGLLEAKDTRSR
ncbi:sensor histidine kinase KdpD [Massilia sp. Se16.2.3]|uniref:sensor histidine kinase n=1 Tax=Massilia sp. Se16.2.3 TaxID=2709303 RepID=UPI0016047D2C|nr:ATP-binding protein [Massilia sp. Se16.2.3]QNB00869.1 ATP-binding protein [Massilia sp. Se16.2.3]